MSSLPPHEVLDEKRYNFMAAVDDVVDIDEIAQLKMQLGVLKSGNPFLVAEIALDLQIERLRVAEIMKARDSVLNRLSDAYISIRQKNEIIERLQEERESNGAAPFPTHLIRVRDTVEIDRLKAHISTLEGDIERLRSLVKPPDPPPCYEENIQKKSMIDAHIQTEDMSTTNALGIAMGDILYTPPETEDPIELVKGRNSILAAIPLPDNPPDATLTAIVIPTPVTLHEFLSLAPPPLKNLLSSYRILHNNTTTWCPDREEHGFMYVPMFKCNTNPKIATAHKWSAFDPVGKMSKPTECFYHKEGVWYYAGLYKAFKMDILTTKEWGTLPTETTSVIIKETIAARKNSSPQNTYETSQLYACGALKVACIGLQCVGFNREVYKSILEHSAKLAETKWKTLTAKISTAADTVTMASSPTIGPTTMENTASTTCTAAKVTKAPRHVQRTASFGAPAVASTITPGIIQTTGTLSTLQATPKITAVGIGASPVTMKTLSSGPPSIWTMNTGQHGFPSSLTGPGANLSPFSASSSPLSATSKIFESAIHRSLPRVQKSEADSKV